MRVRYLNKKVSKLTKERAYDVSREMIFMIHRVKTKTASMTVSSSQKLSYI